MKQALTICVAFKFDELEWSKEETNTFSIFPILYFFACPTLKERKRVARRNGNAHLHANLPASHPLIASIAKLCLCPSLDPGQPPPAPPS